MSNAVRPQVHADRGHQPLPVGIRRYWAGRHVVVTGGSSGIGLAVTDMALDAGASVSVLALDDPALARLKDQARSGTGRLAVFASDVTSAEQVSSALAAARARHGRIGALITCAGVAKPGYFHELEDADFRVHMEVNYFGTLIPVRQTLRDLMAAERASITAVSSAAGFLAVFGYGAYSPSKFAVSAMGEVLRQELRSSGVTVTVVCPPDVDTPMLATEAATKPPELRALSGGRAMTSDEVARALLIGTARGRATVLPGWSTRLLRRVSGTAPTLTTRIIDSLIARVQRRRRR